MLCSLLIFVPDEGKNTIRERLRSMSNFIARLCLPGGKKRKYPKVSEAQPWESTPIMLPRPGGSGRCPSSVLNHLHATAPIQCRIHPPANRFQRTMEVRQETDQACSAPAAPSLQTSPRYPRQLTSIMSTGVRPCVPTKSTARLRRE
jgi:hypothetical protein